MTAVAERSIHPLRYRVVVWLLAAVLGAAALQLVTLHPTPIDRTLPVLAVILAIVAAVSEEAIFLAVPLLGAAEVVFAEERTRLLMFGVILGVAFAVAVFRRRSMSSATIIVVCGLIVVRWLIWNDFSVWRELGLLIVVLLVLATFLPDLPSLAIPVALSVALFTPALPFRSLIWPVVAAIALRLVRIRRIDVPALASVWMFFLLLFFPWSGVAARGPRYFFERPELRERYDVGSSLRAGESVLLALPPNATALLLTGSNIGHLPEGTIVGRLEPGGDVRIGDVADWGVMRREHFYRAQEVLPRRPAGAIRGYGYSAWVHGLGRVPLAAGRELRVTADRTLPPGATLIVDSIERKP